MDDARGGDGMLGPETKGWVPGGRTLGPDDGGDDAGPGRRGDLLTDQNTTGTVMQDEHEDQGHR